MQDTTLKQEKVFHDGWAESIDIDSVMVDESFEACTSPENKIIISKLGSCSGKKILDLGCGAGEAAVYFAKKGAIVTATDISSGMLDVVKQVAMKHGVKVETRESTSDKIDFPDETFDVVYAANLLHHVDIEKTLVEVKRVLKQSGVFVSWDPLAHNPIINIYRIKANQVRTDSEHPLKISDIGIFKKHFSKVLYDTTWFFTLWIFMKFYLIDRIHPNQERYWKKILIEHKKLEKMFNVLKKIDDLLFMLLPFLKRYGWNIVVYAVK